MEIVKKLPEDLRKYILTFTYEFQPFVLLNDIRHYLFSRTLTQDWYYQHNEWKYPGAGQYWLHNDLVRFCNQQDATMFDFFNIFTRLYLLKNKSRDQIIHICNNLSRDCKKTNNITWGLLTIEQRNAFINHL